MHKKFHFFFILLLSFGLSAQNFETEWQSVIEHQQQGHIKDALKGTEDIYFAAKQNNNDLQIVKSFFFRSKFMQVLEEDAQQKIFDNLRADIQLVNEPYKSVLKFIYADCLQSYFQKNNFSIERRTPVENSDDDFTTWTRPQFERAIDATKNHLLHHKTVLKNEPLAQLELILEFDSSERLKHKNVYEFLLQKYIGLYSRNLDSYKEVDPVYRENKSFLMGNSTKFLSLDFSEVKNRPLRTISQLYQELEQENTEDEDLIFQRMEFFENRIFKDTEEYLLSLDTFSKSIKDTLVAQKVQLKEAILYSQLASKTEHPEYNGKAIAVLDSLLKGNSRTNTYKEAFLLKEKIKEKSLSVQMERFVSDNQNARAFVEFKNIEKLTLDFYSVPADFPFQITKESALDIIENASPALSKDYSLPKKEDYFSYTTEILLPSLPKGTYLVHFDAGEKSSKSGAHKNYTYFTVSNLALLQKDGKNRDYFQVVNRKSGVPIKKSTIILDEQTSKTKASGLAKLKRKKWKSNARSQTTITATKNEDSLVVGFYKRFRYANNSYNDDEDFPAVIRFLMDRSIYRPGQKAYIKVIAIQNKKNVKSVVPNLTIAIEVSDPKGNSIKELNVKTNEFGSFTFDFMIPKNGITGTYYIEADEPVDFEKDPYYRKWRDEHMFWDYADLEYEGLSFKVEEYKRPTFKVEFDSLKNSFTINEKVAVSGKAASFSGVALGGSMIKYRVERKSYPDYRNLYFSHKTDIIKEGEITSAADGSFSIEFDAIPETGLDPKSLPIFYYTIYVDVTDSRGETQIAETTIKLGYHDLVLSSEIPHIINSDAKNILTLKSTDLNGNPSSTAGELKVYFKSDLSEKIKDRIFPTPEIPGFTKEAFEALFPYEEYGTESKNDQGELIYSEEISIDGEKEVSLDFLRDREGGNYVAVFSAYDSKNHLIESESSFKLVRGKEIVSDKILTLTQLNQNPFKDGFVRVQIQSPIKKLFLNVSSPESASFAIEQFLLENGIATVIIPIDKKRSEDLILQFQTYFENANFVESLSLSKEKPGELEIEMERFRNKLEPGSEQTWSFKILHGNKPIDAEVLASMYDSSLDQFYSKNWEGLDLYNYYGNRFYSSISNLANEKSYNNLKYLNPDPPKFRFTPNFVDLFWFGFDFVNPGRLYTEKKNQISPTPSNASIVSGMVTDDTGLPLPGVNVVVKGTSRGTQTDFDGYYSIEVALGEELEFSYVGFDPQIIKVGSNQYDISLETGSALEEVVVTGYSATQRTVQSSAVVKVSHEELLQGKTAGVLVSPASGKPGTGSMIRIRGAGSLSFEQGKILIIIDGVPMTTEGSDISFQDKDILKLAKIEADDVANVSILTAEEGVAIYGAAAANGVIVISTKSALEELNEVQTRKNFNETAFFEPQLRTDRKGNISFSFTTPEALTQWKLRVFAHTKKAESGYLENFAITQSDLMVAPNMPRFFREKDSIWITARISNLTAEAKSGTAVLNLFDAETMEPLSVLLDGEHQHEPFQLKGKENTVLTWKLKIPEGIQGIQYRIQAKSGEFSDGEENIIPVLTNRILVTESIPLWLKPLSSKTYNLENLKTNTSSTLKNHQLVLEYTSNPVWLAIQALPYLLEYEHDCSEQVFARYYANNLAEKILGSNPKIADYLKDIELDKESKVEQNEELFSLLLAETPWVLDKMSEEEKKARLAVLMDLQKLAEGQKNTLEKLKTQQLSSGGFPWFEGGKENEFITRHILAGFGKMKMRDTTNVHYISIVNKAVPFIDSKFLMRKDDERREFEKMKRSHQDLHYLYVRSFYSKTHIPSDSLKTEIGKLIKEIKNDWLEKSIYDKALSAIILYRFDEAKTARAIVEHLRQTSSNNEDWGMYWLENTSGYYWYNAPVETQALLINVFAEIDRDWESVEAMKVWLLKNKQTRHWSSTKSTSEAIDALLRSGKNWSQIQPQTEIIMADQMLLDQKIAAAKKEVNSGYFNITFNEKEIKPELAEITIENNSEVPGFGGYFWQYFEDSDKILSSQESPLQIKKHLYIKKNTREGSQLLEINNENPIKLGDLVTVRLIVSSNENMEFIHLKDMRAAGFEPAEVLSGYKSVDGIRYYQSTRDAATHFFFDRLRKGSYVLEYDVRANNIGSFSNGISNIQSMYAPEYGAHSERARVEVGDRN